MENISELSLYVFNNFDDKKYKSIFLVKVNKLLTYDNMEMVLKFSNITSVFDFNSNDNTFDVKIMEILDNGNRNNYNFTLHRLNNSIVPVIGKINEELKNILCDYIYDIISLYK